MIAPRTLVSLYETRQRRLRRGSATPDPIPDPDPRTDLQTEDERRAAYDALIRSWHALAEELPASFGLRLRRGRAPVRYPIWPDRYPAGGGYRILRKPLPEDE